MVTFSVIVIKKKRKQPTQVKKLDKDKLWRMNIKVKKVDKNKLWKIEKITNHKCAKGKKKSDGITDKVGRRFPANLGITEFD